MCGCYDVADCVCFLTFFITALVALLSVQYLVVFLDSFSIYAHGKLAHLLASVYFLVMTLLGCMVFAGIQRRSVFLLKWPGRLLVFLLVSGLLAISAYLWFVDRTHHAGVYDLEGKTFKLSVMIFVVIIYYLSIHKLIATIESPMLTGTHSSPNLEDDSDQLSHPALIADFIKKRGNACKASGLSESNEVNRPYNAASDGINYYVVLLESPFKSGENRYAICSKSRVVSKRYYHMSGGNGEDADDEEDDSESCCSITEV